MKELNISAECVVRHYDASRKNCPASMSGAAWAKWKEFKEKIMEGDSKFIDTKGCFAEKEIEELFKMGIVNGRTENQFFPNEPVTRAEAAVLIRRAIKFITGK